MPNPQKTDGTARAAYTLLRPKKQTSSIVYASPHSGNHYPDDFIQSTPLDPVALRRSEDAFVDELYESCNKFGSPLLKANFPRAYVDLNREPYELDPDMFAGTLPSYVNTDSLRARSGLGTIAKMVTNGTNIYSDKLNFAEVRSRIETLYHPYHAALRQMIEDTRLQFGACLLIDCHSMPSIGGQLETDPSLSRADIILGDRFGTTCAPWISDFVHHQLQSEGFVVRRNRPYAGGFTTQHYSDQPNHIHTLQIEINRDIYMNEEDITRLPEFRDLQKRLEKVIAHISAIESQRLKND